MPITAATMVHTPYLFSAFSGFQGTHGGTHSRYNAGAVRVDYATIANNSGLEVATFTKSPTGNTIYLTYQKNEITSVRLPCPPPAGVTAFTTDNLSGCKIFVDTITGSNDIIVYHANARMHSPPGNHGAVNPTLETGAATLHLNTLYANAQPAYTLQGLVLVAGSSIDKPFYNQNPRAAVQRKIGHNRKRLNTPDPVNDPNVLDQPEFVGGTVVMGFYRAAAVPPHWEIRYQTWGTVEYKRPNYAPKGWFKGRDKKADNFKVMQHGQVF